jgi:hypothetical protein
MRDGRFACPALRPDQISTTNWDSNFDTHFFEVLVDIDGRRRQAWLFLMRLMYSGRDFAWMFWQAPIVVIPFTSVRITSVSRRARARVRALRRPAGARGVRQSAGGGRSDPGRRRGPLRRGSALASHYLLKACFCRPGEGQDKGGVDAHGKAVRQQALVPIPTGTTLATINARLLARMDARVDTTRDAVGQRSRLFGGGSSASIDRCRPPFAHEATTLTTVTPQG